VRDEVRASRRDRVRFAGAEPYFLLGIAEEEPDSPLQDIERVLDVAVIVPGDGLTWRDLQLGDPKTRTLGVTSAPLDLVEMARVLHTFHDGLLAQPLTGASAWTASNNTLRLRASSVSKVDRDRNTVSMPASR